MKERSHRGLHRPGAFDQEGLQNDAKPLQPLRALVVDDNSGDRYLLKEALHETGIPFRLSEIDDAVTALSLCRRNFQPAEAPEIIFLDINLPKCDGFQLLQAIRRNRSLSQALVVMCSSSRSEEDIVAAYGLGANIYVDKGRDLDDILRVTAGVIRFCCLALRKTIVDCDSVDRDKAA